MSHFPATDTEPERYRPSGKQLLGAGLALVVCAAVGLGVFFGVDQGSGRPAATRAAKTTTPAITATGRIVVADDATGKLVIVAPSGQDARPAALSVQANAEQGVVGYLSPAGNYLATSDGSVFAVAATATAPLRPVRRIATTKFVVADEPWAGRSSLALVHNSYGSGPIRLMNIATGAATSLGSGLSAAGDPIGGGALVAREDTKTYPDANAVGQDQIPVAALDLRAPGKPSATLLTAVRFAQLLGLPTTDPYNLQGWFSPNGRYLTVAGTDQALGRPVGGLVVLTRTGQLVTKASTAAESYFGYWSPDSRTLAYAAQGGGALDLVLYHPNDPARDRTVAFPPETGGYLGQCVWSPDSVHLICTQESNRWALVDAATGHYTSEIATTGSLLAWLPAG
jgi:WD40-like Beta Propeller Repeat.